MSLRKKLIRLAHSNPEIRPALLPLLKEAGDDTPLAVGDMLVSSWGYDQTNIDFYQITRLTPKMAVIRKVESKVVRTGGEQEWVVPQANKFKGPPVRKKVSKGWDGGVYLSLSSYSGASKWDGKPKARTAFGYGH